MTAFAGADHWPVSAIPAAYLRPGTGSFTEFLATAEPHLLPGSRQGSDGAEAIDVIEARAFCGMYQID